MKKRLVAIILCLLVSACQTEASNTNNNAIPESIALETDNAPSDGSKNMECLHGEMAAVGESIARKFEGTTTKEVMGWFCEGAEFEDILTALQTEKITEYPAQELLEMVAAGYSWDRIWETIGFISEEADG